jgi:hypothetical protein
LGIRKRRRRLAARRQAALLAVAKAVDKRRRRDMSSKEDAANEANTEEEEEEENGENLLSDKIKRSTAWQEARDLLNEGAESDVPSSPEGSAEKGESEYRE